jgi:putative membrane protein
MDIDSAINWHSVLSALIFSGIGLGIYTLGFVILTLLTPNVHIWREINEEKNVAIAIFLGSIALGIAIIISAAVRG